MYMKRPIAILISLALLILSYPLQANSLPKQFLDKMAELKQPLTRHVIVVDVTSQKLFLYNDHKIVTSYPISTSSKGTGQESNSYKTPLGAHRIAEKIGQNAPINAIFVERKNTGKIWSPLPKGKREKVDLVLTRILWLEGLEKGFNQGIGKGGKSVDSFQRYIYIHGTNAEDLIGTPASKGCIRMKNEDLISLFAFVDSGSLVYISYF
ncbi:putative L,D-transpeptidase ErfK/SrfK [Parachlamydia acanthamoebae UV-7]|uniref:Putative L,D-transpeptidase ErfK/SrfK n=3 Tax=Parachlamydiaceae TaxID=92713 RepID=F8KWL3_PARAV|nr:putative L,D-transpeptidase ErfK/SrfK [Parachlamydia acanthamoebae UV-7]